MQDGHPHPGWLSQVDFHIPDGDSTSTHIIFPITSIGVHIPDGYSRLGWTLTPGMDTHITDGHSYPEHVSQRDLRIHLYVLDVSPCSKPMSIADKPTSNMDIFTRWMSEMNIHVPGRACTILQASSLRCLIHINSFCIPFRPVRAVSIITGQNKTSGNSSPCSISAARFTYNERK